MEQSLLMAGFLLYFSMELSLHTHCCGSAGLPVNAGIRNLALHVAVVAVVYDKTVKLQSNYAIKVTRYEYLIYSILYIVQALMKWWPFGVSVSQVWRLIKIQ